MFFNANYIRGDNSEEGFTDDYRTLEQRTKDEVNGVMNILNLSTGAKLLDVPCGYGRHSIELAFRGQDVTGVDITIFFWQKQ